VSQSFTNPWFSPAYTFNFAGDAVVEEKVVSEVASYGRQLGILNEIVLALAKNDKAPEECVERLAAIMKDIKEIKDKQKKSNLDAAKEALDELEKSQPACYKLLLQERYGKLG
jgi:transcription elongation factor GreA-like protein